MSYEKNVSGKSELYVKICIIGPFNSGKSSIVHKLAEDILSDKKFNSTISLDYNLKQLSTIDLNIFGETGCNMFDFMSDIILEGQGGLMVVVDSLCPETFKSVKNFMNEIISIKNIPTVVLANKQDLSGAFSPDTIKKKMELSDEIPVIGTIANNGKNLELSLRKLLDKIVNIKKSN